MVQEFHVLRCFSCKTFQVQQVKKSKKWSCNMCGEKQSLIKEYGRGTGADCRRHVQKLNTLRGELLEVEHESAWTHWEKEEECEAEVSPGDVTRSWQQKGQGQVLSRWSKYVNQKEIGPESEEDEHEEKERVYTDTEQRRQNNIRKRKKSFPSRATYRRYNVEEEQDKDTVNEGAATQPSQPRCHDATFNSLVRDPQPSTGFPPASIRLRTDALCAPPAALLGSEGIRACSDICSQFTGANKKSSAESQHSVPLSSFSAPSFSHQQPSKTKLEAKDSKWARFLPSVCVEDEEDGGEHAQCLDEDHTALVQSPRMPVAAVIPKNIGSTSSGRSEGALLDTMWGVEKETVFEQLSQRVNGSVCKQPTSSSNTSRPTGSQRPVCVQALPKPAFSFSTLFHTNEDFDDTY